MDLSRKHAWAKMWTIMLMTSVVCGLVLAAGSPSKVKTTKESAMSGFIVSDAHLGWRHPSQPSNMMMAQAIGYIREQFPNLDVFIDTGDIHHGNSDDIGRRDWTEVIGSGIGRLPFYIAAGNHEIVNFGSAPNFDLEARVMRLTSMTCRPYFSFDIKGIHIVCLPELIMVNLVTDEALAWLDLDLSLNKDKTTLIMTHNSLRGTTQPHDSKVYRQVANTKRVMKVLDRYPNVVAWMHGHNHTWELVKKDGRFYVSNGRIGGFSPPYKGNYGAGHLGGIYFEVGKDYITIRGYSATKRCFFDEIPGYEHMSQTMKIKSSYDPEAPSAVSWGMGLARDGLRVPAYQHHIISQEGKQELFVTGTEGPVFSENVDFSAVAEQTEGWSKARAISGLNISPKKDIDDEIDGIRFLKPGLEILPLANGNKSRSVYSPQSSAKNCYYHCVPGRSYQARIKAKALQSGPKCKLIFHVYDSTGKNLYQSESDLQLLDTANKMFAAACTIPQTAAANTIYEDPKTDNMVNIVVEVKFEDLTVPVQLYEFALMQKDGADHTEDVKIRIHSKDYVFPGKLKKGRIERVELTDTLDGREVVETHAAGSGCVTWLVRQSDLAYQVRNAPAGLAPDGSLDVGPVRNEFSERKEVIIVPLKRPDTPYVHRMQRINRCRIEPYDPVNKEMRVHVMELFEGYTDIKILNAPGSLGRLENVGHRNVGANITDMAGVEVKEVGPVVVGF